jgi:uncharacterized protein (TIGR02118 family)
MIKIVWLLRRAPDLSLEEFSKWWLEKHAPMIVNKQGRFLKRYIVNIRIAQDNLPAATGAECEWDGLAEEWFENEDEARAALTLPTAAEGREDVLRHVSGFQRLIVTENQFV